MVAKIGRGSSLFSALAYNQNKVGEGTARVISADKVIIDGQNPMQKMIFSFDNYLAANRKTEKPIVHISLNPSPRDTLTDGQFAALAADYLARMGYGEQPYVVFLHEDTGRRHIHIVTTCVDENGRKINSNYEWRRSMAACRELEEKYGLTNSAAIQKPDEPRLKKADHTQGDLKRQIANTLKSVVASYKFQTFGEFSALLACYNIEAKQVRGDHEGAPYTGIVYTATNERGEAVGAPFKSSLFGRQFGQDALDKKMARHAVAFRQRKWSPTIRDTVRLAMHACRGDREKFEQTLRAKGLDVVFRTNEQGRIYGVTFIDHNTREVFNGSRLGKEFSANTFERLFTKPTQALRLPDFPGLDLAPHTEPEPYDDTPYIRKRKKKRLCKTTTI